MTMPLNPFEVENDWLVTADNDPNRRCMTCDSPMPKGTYRKRNHREDLVCEECKPNQQAHWSYAGVPPGQLDEFVARESEARASMHLVEAGLKGFLSKTAHDYGDGATISHCCVCGSGGIVGGSDGTIECTFCHTVFSVQIQPAQPFMPQTVDGQPFKAPDLPAQAGDDLSDPQDRSVPDEVDDESPVTALYVAADGTAMGEDAYVASLAADYRQVEVDVRVAALSGLGRR